MVELLKFFLLGGPFGGAIGLFIGLMMNVTAAKEEEKLSVKDVLAVMLVGFLMMGALFAALFTTV